VIVFRPKGVPVARIAIIEPDQLAADSLALYCEALGHEARVAWDGHAGVELVASWRPDAVACELDLPGDVDGFEVGRQVRSLPGGDQMRLVAYTRLVQAAYGTQSEQAGFCAYLEKPAAAAELVPLLVEEG
jgi:CheY-like chemotaxis protein